MEMLQGLFTIIGVGSLVLTVHSRDKTHCDRNLQLENINAITSLRKFLCDLFDLSWLDACKLEALLIWNAITIADNLEEEGDITCLALSAHSFRKGLLLVVHRLFIIRIVVHDDFDGVGSSFSNPSYGPSW